MPMAGSSAIGLDFVNRLKDVYSVLNKDDDERFLADVHSLIEFSLDRRNPTNKVLERIGRLIVKHFEFKTASIGLRSDDGTFRYVAFVGHSRDAEDALRLQRYDLSEMIDYDKFPNIRIGSIAQYNPVEGFPAVESELVGHHIPALPKSPRKEINAFLPGDYVDFYMHGHEERLIGWIELSDTKDGKLPKRESIRQIELLTDVSAVIIQLRLRFEKEETE